VKLCEWVKGSEIIGKVARLVDDYCSKLPRVLVPRFNLTK
jgi:hypothetical protein